jgi:hypothetical protein
MHSNPHEQLILTCMKLTGFQFRVSDLTLNANYPFLHMEIVSKDHQFDGMQIIWTENEYEVSEYQAGPKENELHIYFITKSLKIALKHFMKGNKQKPIKIWN